MQKSEVSGASGGKILEGNCYLASLYEQLMKTGESVCKIKAVNELEKTVRAQSQDNIKQHNF